MEERKTFYIATSYLEKSKALSLALSLMDYAPNLWPSYPWWMFAAEEDQHPKHLGAVGELEIKHAAESDIFIWLHPARKGAWCELGAACYRNIKSGGNQILFVLPKSLATEYLPPFCYQPGVTIVMVPDETFFNQDTHQLASWIKQTLRTGK